MRHAFDQNGNRLVDQGLGFVRTDQRPALGAWDAAKPCSNQPGCSQRVMPNGDLQCCCWDPSINFWNCHTEIIGTLDAPPTPMLLLDHPEQPTPPCPQGFKYVTDLAISYGCPQGYGYIERAPAPYSSNCVRCSTRPRNNTGQNTSLPYAPRPLPPTPPRTRVVSEASEVGTAGLGWCR